MNFRGQVPENYIFLSGSGFEEPSHAPLTNVTWSTSLLPPLGIKAFKSQHTQGAKSPQVY